MYHRVDDEVTRKADSTVSNIIVRNRFHLVPLPFLFLGLLEGAVRFYLLVFVCTAAAAAAALLL